MSPFWDLRNVKGILCIILKLTWRAWTQNIKGQFNIIKWAKRIRRDKMKNQEGSQRVIAMRIKGEETLSFGYT